METKDIIIGVVIGIILTYIFLGKQTQTVSQLLQMQNRIQHQLYYQNHQNQYQPIQLSQTGSTYKNDEKWEILRDKSGFISNIRVVRDARVT